MSFQESEKYIDAADSYQDALSISPTKLWIYEPLVACLSAAGEFTRQDWKELLAEIESSVRLNSGAMKIGVATTGELDLKEYEVEIYNTDGEVTYEFPKGARKLYPETKFPGGAEVAYALGQAADEAGDYEKAWKYYSFANNLEQAKRELFTPKIAISMTSYFKNMYDKDFFDPEIPGYAGVGLDTTYPIFIVGMPFCGAELLEAILDGHSDIFGLNAQPEYYNVLQGQIDKDLRYSVLTRHAMATQDTAFKNFNKVGWKGVKQRVNEFAQVVKGNMEKIASHVSRQLTFPMPKHYIDTDVSNYMNLGLIHSFFPKAKIVHLIRDPLDLLLEVYIHHYSDPAGIAESSFTVEGVVLSYITYLDLMHHWKLTMPGAIIEMSYDELRLNPKTTVAPLLKSLKLQWQDKMYDYRASKLQRKPSGYWRHYSKQLSGMIKSLDGALAMLQKSKMLPLESVVNWQLSKNFPYEKYNVGAPSSAPSSKNIAGKPPKTPVEETTRSKKDSKSTEKQPAKEKEKKASQATDKQKSKEQPNAAASSKKESAAKKKVVTENSSGKKGVKKGFAFKPLTAAEKSKVEKLCRPLLKQYDENTLNAYLHQFAALNVNVELIDQCVVGMLLKAQGGHQEEVIKLLGALLDIRMDIPGALTPAIQLLSGTHKKESLEKCAEYANHLVSLMPKDESSYMARSKCNLGLAKYEEAHWDLNRALNITGVGGSKYYEILMERAQLYIRMKHHSSAFIELNNIIKAGKATPQTYFLLGQTEVTFAHIQKSVEACKLFPVL